MPVEEALNPEHESDVYIGSTCEPSLAHRMAGHRRNYKSWKKGNYSHVRSFDLFDIYGVDNCNILLLESYSCLNKDELRQREGFYIKSIPCVNKNIPGRSNKEYKKLYYENNKEAISNWRNTNCKCFCGGCYSRRNKATHYKSLKHINYMTIHDDIIEKVNDLMISMKQLKSICSINYSNI